MKLNLIIHGIAVVKQANVAGWCDKLRQVLSSDSDLESAVSDSDSAACYFCVGTNGKSVGNVF
jgi:hypothetical protein